MSKALKLLDGLLAVGLASPHFPHKISDAISIVEDAYARHELTLRQTVALDKALLILAKRRRECQPS
jgi:hypothetical protein